ncbi:nuclear transport factor 2 family protein [Bacteroidota bacterium]
MKKLNLLLIVLILLSFGACNPKVDVVAEKDLITNALDEIYNAMQTKDADSYLKFFDEGGLFCGSDPGEFWDYEAAKKIINDMMSNSSLNTKYTIDKREIRVADDGKTAITLEQYTVEYVSKYIPARIINHFVKKDGNWLIDFMSFGLIPYNADIGKINGAFQEE